MTAGARSALPLGDYKTADRWQTHINTLFYGILGPGIHDHFQTYVSRDHRLAHALAENFFHEARRRGPAAGTRFVQERGVGNGNLAGCFLTHLRAIDRAGEVYPRTHYILCDYSAEILKGARRHPALAEHRGRFSTVRIDAANLGCFRPASVEKIISNEIWDDLATRVLLKHDGQLLEEYLQPALDPGVLDVDFGTFLAAFEKMDLGFLAAHAAFLPQVTWEHHYQRVDISDWPYSQALVEQVAQLAEGVPVPVNTGAFATLERARELLAPGGQGYTGFDYGMFSIGELNREGRPYFNLYGGQYTFMVNFDLLERVGRAIGFTEVEKTLQHRFVGEALGERVLSLVEILQSHPDVPRLDAWDRDLLMLATMNALNAVYKSPYKRKLTYPAMPGTPKKKRKQIEEMAGRLSPRGVPDTVAYVTEGEVRSALKPLVKLGYRERGLREAFSRPPEPISFIAIRFA